MRSITKRIVCASCMAVSTLYAQTPDHKGYTGPKDKLHVYLLIGQSNMAGRAKIEDGDAGVIQRCFLLNGEGEWEPATNPLNRYSSIRKNLSMQRMNPGCGFSKAMLEKSPGISIGLVVNAKGGTRIEHWKKGTLFYEEALKRARKAQGTGVMKGILWHQGESNSKNPDGYLEKLRELVMDLREDLDAPNLPFVAGQVFYDPARKPNTKAINTEISRLPDAVHNTGVVKSEGLTTSDSTHFDTQGMRLLGQRYAEEMLKLQAE